MDEDSKFYIPGKIKSATPAGIALFRVELILNF